MTTREEAEQALRLLHLELDAFNPTLWPTPDADEVESERLRNIVRTRLAELEALVPRPIPVSERLPQDGEIVLYPSSAHWLPVHFLARADGQHVWTWDSQSYIQPTHWLPMPKPLEGHDHQG
jgi:hypothetical protein